jgi:hypothetical protein
MKYRMTCLIVTLGIASMPSSRSFAIRTAPISPAAAIPMALTIPTALAAPPVLTAARKLVPILRKPPPLSRLDLSFMVALGAGLVALQLRRTQSLLTAQKVPARAHLPGFAD